MQRVFLDHHDRDLMRRAPDGSQLGEDVLAFTILLEHTTHTTRLSFEALEALDQLLARDRRNGGHQLSNPWRLTVSIISNASANGPTGRRTAGRRDGGPTCVAAHAKDGERFLTLRASTTRAFQLDLGQAGSDKLIILSSAVFADVFIDRHSSLNFYLLTYYVYLAANITKFVSVRNECINSGLNRTRSDDADLGQRHLAIAIHHYQRGHRPHPKPEGGLSPHTAHHVQPDYLGFAIQASLQPVHDRFCQ
jgi:hypothetical protein